MIRTTIVAAAFAALAGTAAWATETTTTTTTESAPSTSVTVEHSQPSVVEHHEVTTGTVSSDCKSKTVKKENEMGDTKTVHKEKCD